MATRSYRNTDPGKHKDTWFEQFDVIDQWLFLWLCDHADLGGWVDLEWRELLRDFKLPRGMELKKGFDMHRYLLKALERLSEPFDGFRRLYFFQKHPEHSVKSLIWITNHAKIQANGKTRLSPNAPFEKGVLRSLCRFPESEESLSEAFRAIDSLYMASSGYRRFLGKGKGKGRERESSSDSSPKRSRLPRKAPEEYRGKDAAYDLILDAWDIFPLAFESYLQQIRQAYGRVDDRDAVLIVKKALAAAESSVDGVDNPFLYLRSEFSKFEVERYGPDGQPRERRNRRVTPKDVEDNLA